MGNSHYYLFFISQYFIYTSPLSLYHFEVNTIIRVLQTRGLKHLRNHAEPRSAGVEAHVLSIEYILTLWKT